MLFSSTLPNQIWSFNVAWFTRKVINSTLLICGPSSLLCSKTRNYFFANEEEGPTKAHISTDVICTVSRVLLLSTLSQSLIFKSNTLLFIISLAYPF